MNLHFGPWAAPLEHAAQSRLTTFWRIRISMLPRTAVAPPTLARRSLVPLWGIALAILAVPTIQLSRAPAAAPEAPQKDGGPCREA